MKHEDKLFFVVNILVWVIIYGMCFCFATGETEADFSSAHRTIDKTDSAYLTVESVETVRRAEISDVDDYGISYDGETYAALEDGLSGNYISKSGETFYFGPDGYYAGFFDSKEKNIEGGSYVINTTEGQITISIINPDATSMVVYLLQMDGPENYILVYEPANLKIELEKKDG
jgi:hypothetical protein